MQNNNIFQKRKYQIKNLNIHILYERYKNKKIILNTKYQRGSVWNIKKQINLIDTIIKSFPIPFIIFYEIERNIYECIDGKQRLLSIFNFIEDNFEIKINNVKIKYSDINYENKQHFNRTEIGIILLIDKWNDNEIEDIFNKIQYGVTLSTGEILNSKNTNSKISIAKNILQKIENIFYQIFKNKVINRNNDIICILKIIKIISINDTDLRTNKIKKWINDKDKYHFDQKYICEIINFIKNINSSKIIIDDINTIILLFYIYHQYYDINNNKIIFPKNITILTIYQYICKLKNNTKWNKYNANHNKYFDNRINILKKKLNLI